MGEKYLIRYDNLKKQLVSQSNISMIQYRDGKQSFLKELREQAELFSEKNN